MLIVVTIPIGIASEMVAKVDVVWAKGSLEVWEVCSDEFEVFGEEAEVP